MCIRELIRSSDIEGVKAWIESETTNKNVIGDRIGDSPLMYALWRMEKNISKVFIENDLYIFDTNNNGTEPLHRAAINGYTKITLLLIEKGAKVNAANKNGLISLHYAVICGHFKIARILIEKGAKVNAVEKYGCLPLHYAADNGRVDVVRILIENGSEINTINHLGNSPLANSICQSSSFGAIKILLDEGAALFNNINYLEKSHKNNKTLVKHHFKLQAFILVCKENNNMLYCLNRSVILRFSKTFKLSFEY